jgi:hypothetical protein
MSLWVSLNQARAKTSEKYAGSCLLMEKASTLDNCSKDLDVQGNRTGALFRSRSGGLPAQIWPRTSAGLRVTATRQTFHNPGVLLLHPLPVQGIAVVVS